MYSFFKKLPIRLKFIYATVLISVISFVISFGSFLIYEINSFSTKLIADLELLSQRIIRENEQFFDFYVFATLQNSLYDYLEGYENVEYGAVFLYDPVGTPFLAAYYDRALPGNEEGIGLTDPEQIRLYSSALADSNLIQLSEASSVSEFLTFNRYNQNFLLALENSRFRPVFQESSTNPFYSLTGYWRVYFQQQYLDLYFSSDDVNQCVVFVRSDLSGFYAQFWRLIKAIGVIFLFTSVSVVGLSVYAQRFIAKPITDLTSFTQKITDENNFSLRIPVNSQDDLGTLQKGMNTMLTHIEEQNSELKLAKERAEQSAIAKQQFLSSMSHEIRTPIHGIDGVIRMLENTTLTEKQQSLLGVIRRTSEHLRAIIDDILDQSKIEAGKMNFEQNPINLSEMIDTLLLTFKPRTDELNLQILTNIDPQLPQVFVGDSVRFYQILLNLFSNAVKFTPMGQIELIGELAEDKGDLMRIRFSVRDTGIGIPAEKIELIFQQFVQASGDTARKFGGTGLGLSITKSLVELQGGRIWATSEYGFGSTFTFEMPFKKVGGDLLEVRAQAEVVNEEAIRAANLAGKRVLLAEDNKTNQLVMESLLKRWLATVDLANNGEEALQLARQNSYDLVIMDVHMPDMDGYTATQKIRELSGSASHVPILAMTASALPGEAEKCLAAGMDDYISKPFAEKKLFDLLTALLNRFPAQT